MVRGLEEDDLSSARGLLLRDRLVRATLEGRKTQTRRLDRRFTKFGVRDVVGRVEPLGDDYAGDAWLFDDGTHDGRVLRCPHGKVGDRLWVREAWMKVDFGDIVSLRKLGIVPGPMHGAILYRSTSMSPFVEVLVRGGARWKPGIHLRRADARTWLEVTRIRCQRLHAITEEDAVAEGIQRAHPRAEAGDAPCGDGACGGYVHPSGVHVDSAREVFRALWDSINQERGAWATNPLVWVVDYRRIPVPNGGAS